MNCNICRLLHVFPIAKHIFKTNSNEIIVHSCINGSNRKKREKGSIVRWNTGRGKMGPANLFFLHSTVTNCQRGCLTSASVDKHCLEEKPGQ
jgi:hypothetical protein